MFHDSFATALVPLLAEHFGRTVFLWTYDFDCDAIERERPSVVIQEYAERMLSVMTPRNPPQVSDTAEPDRQALGVSARKPVPRDIGGTCREPLGAPDKRTSRVLLAAGGAPLRHRPPVAFPCALGATAWLQCEHPHQDFGPSGPFVVRSCSACSHGSPHVPPTSCAGASRA